jgi:hypothetical protein
MNIFLRKFTNVVYTISILTHVSCTFYSKVQTYGCSLYTGWIFSFKKCCKHVTYTWPNAHISLYDQATAKQSSKFKSSTAHIFLDEIFVILNHPVCTKWSLSDSISTDKRYRVTDILMYNHSTSATKACTHCIGFADCVSHLATECPKEAKFVCLFICQSKGIQLLFQFLVTSAHQCKHIMAIYTDGRHN